ncbi:MAG TPA: dienelactone hydrolase family protein [Bryobacteraceae bacterium]|nr:dienelactone hydrolase family protein [Bryobacteraceae bacterium]
MSENVIETDVEIRTPDGICDAAYIHPTSGSHAGVLFWADAGGLRPVTRKMGRRLAAEGYSVLVPNPFYRVSKAPFAAGFNLNFQNPADMAKLRVLFESIKPAGYAERDAAAFVEFLDAQKEVDGTKPIGAQGYCMGGALVMRSAAALPGRIGAGASFHGGGLVTDGPDSPHLLVPKIKARMYFGVAADDDEKQPDAKNKLRQVFAEAGIPVEIEVYSGLHGWCMEDMPARGDRAVYMRAEAERAWGKLLGLYRTALA